jgi:hypothetical protein
MKKRVSSYAPHGSTRTGTLLLIDFFVEHFFEFCEFFFGQGFVFNKLDEKGFSDTSVYTVD